MFGELGWECRGINEGLAVIYSELEDTNYTGIGVSFGGGLCNVALAYLSMPAISFSIPKGGDFIDASAASVTGDLVNRIRITKEENFHFNGHYVDQLHQVLTVYYDDMIQSVISAMKEAFTKTKLPKLSKPIPMVLSGGTACPAGFRERFDKALRATDFPVTISEVRMAKDPLHTTARGALIAALTEM
jgi:tRNA A37 threonylcarbamoyltransferase TsaD